MVKGKKAAPNTKRLAELVAATGTASRGKLRKTLDELAAADESLQTVTLAEIGKRYNVSRPYLLNEINAGRLPAKIIGRKYLITVANLRAWLAADKRG